jgi:quercetin dioxygenase-like cupin family protein
VDHSFAFIEDLAERIEIPEDGILTKTHFEDEHVKVVLFGFSAGQELSEHTSSKAATLQFVRGEASVRVGDNDVVASQGTWIYMPPHLPHTIKTKTPVAMLLVLMKSKDRASG